METREATCKERLPEHLKSRLQDFTEMESALVNAANSDEEDDAHQRIDEYPLGMSTYTVIRLELSTGGPGDWLEYFFSAAPEDGGMFSSVDLTRIEYHFNDWFDHASQTLEGDDFHTAEIFGMNAGLFE